MIQNLIQPSSPKRSLLQQVVSQRRKVVADAINEIMQATAPDRHEALEDNGVAQ